MRLDRRARRQTKAGRPFEARREAMNGRFLGALLLGVAGCAGQAWAHGGVSIDQGQRVMKIGPDTMTFTGYQPQNSRGQFFAALLRDQHRQQHFDETVRAGLAVAAIRPAVLSRTPSSLAASSTE
jgi:hypothetical protein